MRALATIAAVLGLVLVAVAPARAASCGDAVVGDWTDGRIDGRYPPHCYADAIESLPEDMRAYSTAADDIALALGARIRELRANQSAGDDAAATPRNAGTMPIALLSGAGIALALGLAALGRLAGRRLRERFGHRATRLIGQW